MKFSLVRRKRDISSVTINITSFEKLVNTEIMRQKVTSIIAEIGQ